MEYLLKSSAVIILFYLCFHLFLRKETFFQHNRGFLLIGLVIALVFPLIVIPVYIPLETVIVPEFQYLSTIASQTELPSATSTFQWTDLIPIVYGIGLIIFLIQFLFQFGSLLLLVLKNPKNRDGIYTYVTVKYDISPFSFFKWIVFNPNAFKDDELELILTHEKVHASQLHSIDILLTQLACSVFWFNPLMWLYRKDVRQNLEYIADFKTQTTSNKDRTYQHLLLKTSVTNHQIPLSNNFYNSLIKERIVMLKKSRSNKRKQWRYLLILPLLAGLLMSVSTKEVYVEANSTFEKPDNTFEFVVTKKTTDSDLKSMSKSVEQKEGSLVFSDIKRNEKNELTSVFVKLYNHSYGGGNSIKPIEDFIIYKELSGLKGGYVGRLGNGTTHFGSSNLNAIYSKENEGQRKAFEKRVQSAVIKNGLFSEEDKKRADNSEIIEIIITKITSDSDLNNIKKELQSKGITFNYSNLKRNAKGEITAIKTKFKNDKNSTNYNVSGDEGLKSFQFKSSDDTFSVGTVDSNTFIYKSDNNSNVNVQSSGNNRKVVVIDEEDEKGSTSLSMQTLKNKDTVYFVQRNNKFTLSTGDEDSNIFINESDEPIFIINGKKVEKSFFEDVDSDDIQSVFILKGEKALEKYGDEGKNGVILMTKKGSNNLFIESKNDANGNVFIESKNEFIIETDGDEPLYILDGNVINKNKMKDINPNEIENVEILKDKSAVTLYGEKGEHGVIVINTKKNIGKSVSNVVTTFYVEDHEERVDVLTKNATKADLDKIKKDLKAQGIDAKFSKVKRNKAGEITTIKISLNDNNGRQSSASFKEKNQAIPKIVMGKKGNKLFINSIEN